MGSFLKEAKWMLKQAKPFASSLVLIIVLGMASALTGVAIAVISKEMIDSAIKNNGGSVLWMAGAFALTIVLHIVFEAVSSVLSSRTSENISNSLQKTILNSIAKAEWLENSKYPSGDILTRLNNDVATVTFAVSRSIPDVISLSVQLIVAFITLLYFEPILAVLAFLIGPFAILVSRLIGRKLKYMHLKRQETESRYRQFLQEFVFNMPVIKAFNIEEKNFGKIEGLQKERIGWVIKRSRLEAASRGALSLGYWLGFFLAFGWGTMRLSSKKASFGTFAAFLQLVEQIQAPFIGLSYNLPQLAAASASVGRLIELENLKAEENAFDIIKWDRAGICFERVSFSYEAGREVLKDISFDIRPGEIVGLMGASGQGKTTMVRLLLAFIKPDSGCIRFTDGVGCELEAGTAARSLISYVPQGNTLFSGTIAENLLDGDANASSAEMQKALEAAGAWGFVQNLPGGMDFTIKERGQGLSEGQAQRIVIARALIRKTPILILDESTSQLDSETEKDILEAIARQEPPRTCIIITHRREALKYCDRIKVLKDGVIIDQQ